MPNRSSGLASVVIFPLMIAAPAFADVTTIAQVRGSGDITVAPNGDIFVSDFGNPSLSNGTQVVRVAPDGSQSVFVSGLQRALEGNDIDASGNLFQIGFRSSSIYQIDPNANVTLLANAPGPVGVVVSDDNDIFITLCQSNGISRVDRDGTVSEIASGGGLNCPNGIDIGHDGAFYVVNNRDGGMYRVGRDGTVSLFATIPGGGNGHVVFVNQHYCVAGRLAHRVYQVDVDGNVQPFAGTGVDGNTDGPALEATLSRPNGIGASPDGRFLYVIGGSNFSAPTLALRRIDLPLPEGSFAINAGLSGAWFDPATPGQGLLFDVIEDAGVLFAAWFTFESGDSAKIGDPSHRWLTAQGPISGDTATLDISLTQGGQFSVATEVSNTTIGAATLVFSSCTEATFEYALDSGETGSTSLLRLTPDQLCETLAAP